MKTILAPIDFSDASFNSAHYAAALANVFNAELVLIHAYVNPTTIDEMPRELFTVPETELDQVLSKFMEENVEVLRKKFTIKIKGIVKEGRASVIIENLADQTNADLVVMGLKGKGKTKSLFGSNTTHLMRKSSIPVLAIPEGAEFNSFQTILLASDFNLETNFSSYSLLKNFAEKFNATIHILNVRRKNAEFSKAELLEKLNISLAFPNIEAQFYSIEDDDVDDGIEDFLEKNPSQLLVMIAKKRNFFERLIHKSNTREVSKETRIPLLVLPDRD